MVTGLPPVDTSPPPPDRIDRINAGVALYDAGRDREAAQALLACVPLFAADEQRTRAFGALCANLGAALAECGQGAAAEAAVGKALQIAHQLGDELAQARAHFNLGNLALQSLSLQSCRDHFVQAIAFAACVHGPAARHLQASCLLNLSHLMLSMGQPAAARERLRQLDQRVPAAERDAELQWSWHMQQGRLALEEHQAAPARACFLQALTMARQAGQASYVAQSQAALDELGELADEPGVRQRRLQSLRQHWAQARDQGSPQFLEHAMALAKSLGNATAAAVAEGQSDAAAASQREAQTLHEEGLRAIEAVGNNWHGPRRYHFMDRASLFVQHVVHCRLAQGQTSAAFDASEHGQGRALLDLMQQGPAPPACFAEVASALAATGTHLLKLYYAQGQLHAWWASPDGPLRSWNASAALPAVGETLSAAADCNGLADIVDWTRLQRTLARLGAALLPPEIRSLLLQRQGRLLVVPHMALFMLPFAAMPLCDTEPDEPVSPTTPVLGQGWQVSICNSASCWLHHRRQTARGPAPLTALVVADCGEQLVRTPLLPGLVETPQGEVVHTPAESMQALAYDALPGARREGQAVHALTAGVLLMGPEANKTAVALMMPLADCLHLATHAQWDPLGDNTYLVLAGRNDGPPGHNALFGRDLQGMRLRAQLVVLSACQTGLGGIHTDSYIGLGQSFLAAGARCVLVSLWPLPDDTTCAFMTLFHTRLRTGAQPAEALQAVQAAFKADPLTAAGENWAGFQLLGQAWG
jgi:tetratricopeptide (TPR) repeat protein